MFYIDRSGNIGLTRGDTARLKVDITNEVTSQPYRLGANDILTLTVKKNFRDTEIVFQKISAGLNTIHIEPSDTADCNFGKYIYDVQLETENGDIYTIINPSVFELMKEVTY